ncbi:hypothetical protein [Acetobacter aceti]|nr:hypothetical protein [Acetobacter aceti]
MLPLLFVDQFLQTRLVDGRAQTFMSALQRSLYTLSGISRFPRP